MSRKKNEAIKTTQGKVDGGNQRPEVERLKALPRRVERKLDQELMDVDIDVASSVPTDSTKEAVSFKKDEYSRLPLIPARMVNEYVYCPRLAYLEWVQKEWEASADTVQGSFVHRRVDKNSRETVVRDRDEKLDIVRSLELSSEELGLTAKIDLVEQNGVEAVPVEYKKSKRPHIKNNAWDPDRVQLCVQGLLLRANGFECDYGTLYYAGSRERVKVQFDSALVKLTLESVHALRENARLHQVPPPLKESPKCPRCSLVGICLPDEVNLMNSVKSNLRPISVKHTTAYPLYVAAQGAKVAKDGGELVVTKRTDEGEEVSRVRLSEVSQLAVFGNTYITTPTIRELLNLQIPICWFTYGGWFLGNTISNLSGNIEIRTAQFRKADESKTCLHLARGLVAAKIKNTRTLLRRNAHGQKSDAEFAGDLETMKSLSKKAMRADTLQKLLGFEGHAASLYFKHFGRMIAKSESQLTSGFTFENRNRRPPQDPVNALLSYGYALLVKQFVVALAAVGLDPYRGFMHQERFGRPSLALDLMEPFRSLIVESATITVINNGEIKRTGFYETELGVSMSELTRKKFISAFERRLSQQIQHPLFGYQIEYRRLFEMQARLLGRFLLGEIPDYPNLVVR